MDIKHIHLKPENSKNVYNKYIFDVLEYLMLFSIDKNPNSSRWCYKNY